VLRPTRSWLAERFASPPTADLDRFLVAHATRMHDAFHAGPRTVLGAWRRLAPIFVAALDRVPTSVLPRFARVLFDLFDGFGPYPSRNRVLQRLQERVPDHPMAQAAQVILVDTRDDRPLRALASSPDPVDRFFALHIRSERIPHSLDRATALALAEELPEPLSLEARRLALQHALWTDDDRLEALRSLREHAVHCRPWPTAHITALHQVGMLSIRLRDRSAEQALQRAETLARTHGLARWETYLATFRAYARAAAEPATGALALAAAGDALEKVGDRPGWARGWAAVFAYAADDLDAAENLARGVDQPRGEALPALLRAVRCLTAARRGPPDARAAAGEHLARPEDVGRSQGAFDAWIAAEAHVLRGDLAAAKAVATIDTDEALPAFDHLLASVRRRATASPS